MINKADEFYKKIEESETLVLATGTNDSVTMRIISPVLIENKILFFTNKNTTKFKQLEKNPNCCINIDNFFVTTKAEFCGHTMLKENEKLREAYTKKFHDAFDPSVEHGGTDSDFILLKPIKIKGWETNENGLITFNIEMN